MRVAMIGPFGLRPKGTMAVRALPMARALVKRGHAVTMILPPWDYPDDANRSFDDSGVSIENIALPRSIPLLSHINTTRRLVKRALALRPDVIHCFKPKSYAGLSAWWLWQMKRLGRVKTRLIVDTDDWEGAGGWNDFSGQQSVVSSQYSWAQKKMFAWQENWGLKHNDGITVASRALQSIAWSLGVKRERVAYVPNGVQPSAVSGQWSVVSDQRAGMTILLYTRFFEFKVERVIDMLRRVIEQMPNAKLLVVGKGFFGEEDELLKEAEAIGLRARIEYAGWIDAARLPELFARSSVAIYPFDDTLINRTKCSVKLIDLLAAGVPVVADAVGQNVEYIRHNETGVIVPSGDVEAMANAVIDLLRDPDRRLQLSENAMRDVRERFDWDCLVEAVEQLYQGHAS
jgi:glycosyltransferase involved in cell wall biosynthesis